MFACSIYNLKSKGETVMNEVMNNLKNDSSVETLDNENINTQEHQINNENQSNNEEVELFNSVKNFINGLNLVWNYRSINTIVRDECVSFNQLRSCVFLNNKKEPYYDLYKAVALLLKSGLIGGNATHKKDKNLDDLVDNIIEQYMEDFGFIGLLHLIIINILEDKHFFMGKREMQVFEYMSKNNLSKDLADQNILKEFQEKIQQSQAMSTI